jgi:hypothetical protein
VQLYTFPESGSPNDRRQLVAVSVANTYPGVTRGGRGTLVAMTLRSVHGMLIDLAKSCPTRIIIVRNEPFSPQQVGIPAVSTGTNQPRLLYMQ